VSSSIEVKMENLTKKAEIFRGAKFIHLYCRGSKTPSVIHIKDKKGTVGEDRPVVNYTECESLVIDYVAHKVYKPTGLSHREINAFSYYFDRATEAGLIGNSTH
jgi:hypothetical protein